MKRYIVRNLGVLEPKDNEIPKSCWAEKTHDGYWFIYTALPKTALPLVASKH